MVVEAPDGNETLHKGVCNGSKTFKLMVVGSNDYGLDKIELEKTYKLLGGGISDLNPMPKSQLATVTSQSHASLMMQTNTIFKLHECFFKVSIMETTI